MVALIAGCGSNGTCYVAQLINFTVHAYCNSSVTFNVAVCNVSVSEPKLRTTQHIGAFDIRIVVL